MKVDRVEWVVMPDAATALNALMSGEVDYWESPPWDLLPIMEANQDLTVDASTRSAPPPSGGSTGSIRRSTRWRCVRPRMLAMDQED